MRRRIRVLCLHVRLNGCISIWSFTNVVVCLRRARCSGRSAHISQVMVFPDLSVVVRGVQDGTHKGSYMVSNATDRRVTLPFLAVHHFRDGLLTHRWYTLDHLSLLSQVRVHRVYPLDYEFFVPAELQLHRARGADAPASAVEIVGASEAHPEASARVGGTHPAHTSLHSSPQRVALQ